MIAIPPRIRLLQAIKQTLLPVDWLTLTGVAGVTVRHGRFRFSVKGEVPSLAIHFVDDDTRGDDVDRNQDETVRVMQLDLHADVNLATEVSADDDTGLLQMSLLIAAAVQAMRNPLSPIAQICDWISLNGTGPDDKSTPDHARLEQTLTVVYRVRTDDENVLLAAGETA